LSYFAWTCSSRGGGAVFRCCVTLSAACSLYWESLILWDFRSSWNLGSLFK
jgi:hypothetical protein